jgi:hypothetical protein
MFMRTRLLPLLARALMLLACGGEMAGALRHLSSEFVLQCKFPLGRYFQNEDSWLAQNAKISHWAIVDIRTKSLGDRAS